LSYATGGEYNLSGAVSQLHKSGIQPQALDSLRQPLETGEVSIARANHRVTYPRASCWSGR
jgi:Magnesium chelatase, subunit ChlI